MKIAEIRGKDSRELRLDLQALRKELFQLRFHGVAEEVANTARFRQIKKSIARVHTVLRQRELEEAAKADA